MVFPGYIFPLQRLQAALDNGFSDFLAGGVRPPGI
jgi:hypothetical protein